MAQYAKLLHHQDKSDDILIKLNLNRKVLRNAVETGVRAHMKATSFHPRPFGGFTAWGETVAVLRRELKPLGWSFSEQNGLPISCHKDSGVYIVVASGDADTGLEAETPSSKNSKGSATQQFVSKNFDLFEGSEGIVNYDALRNETWVLLYHYDLKKKEVRYELSSPTCLSASGHYNSWVKRFIFEPISLEQDVDVKITRSVDFTDDIDIDIAKIV